MRRQSGFALFEVLLAAAVALLVAIWASHAIANRVNDAVARQGAQWMLMVRGAVHAYLQDYVEALRHADSPGDLLLHGFQNWSAPTLAELKAAGLLDTGFPEYVRPLMGATIRVLRDGDCPGDHCRVGAIVHSRQALLKASGDVNEHMMAQWLLAADGLGGMVHPSRPGVIGGQTFSLPNPPVGGAQLPTGTVAMMVSHDQVDQAAWLRVGDTRDPQFQADASVQGDISAGGTVSAGQYLELGAVEEWRWPCDTFGTVARNEQFGLLVCQGGLWQLAVRQGGGYAINTRFGCYSPEGVSLKNPVTGSCSCPFGFTSVPISEGGDVTRGMTHGFLCVQ